jgi:hypothetical protein
LFVPATVVAVLFALSTAFTPAADKKEGAEPKAGWVEEQMDNLVSQGPGRDPARSDQQIVMSLYPFLRRNDP